MNFLLKNQKFRLKQSLVSLLVAGTVLMASLRVEAQPDTVVTIPPSNMPVLSPVKDLVYNMSSALLKWKQPDLTPPPENGTSDYTYTITVNSVSGDDPTSIYNATTEATTFDLSQVILDLEACKPYQAKVKPRAHLTPDKTPKGPDWLAVDDNFVDIDGPDAVTAPFLNGEGLYSISNFYKKHELNDNFVVAVLQLNTGAESSSGSGEIRAKHERCRQSMYTYYTVGDSNGFFVHLDRAGTQTDVYFSLLNKLGEFEVYAKIKDQLGNLVAQSTTTLTFSETVMPTSTDGAVTTPTPVTLTVMPTSTGQMAGTQTPTPPSEDDAGVIAGAVITTFVGAAVMVGSTIMTVLACKYGACQSGDRSYISQGYELIQP